MNNIIEISYYNSPFGELIIGSYNNQLCLCDWKYRKIRPAVDKRIQNHLKAEYKERESTIIQTTIVQLEEYFRKERKFFDIPIILAGTQFQKEVWSELIKIQYGETESYLGLSKRIGDEKAIRAVASANGANAVSIFVPCHRIIGSKGELTGYAGGLQTKKKLLDLEGYRKNGQMNLFS